jgi:hypothetical protein
VADQRGLVIAWGVAEGIVIYRSARERIPPRPGQLLVTSGAFVLLAILSEFAPPLALAVGVGIDIAALFQVWPGTTGGGESSRAAQGEAAAQVAAAAATLG